MTTSVPELRPAEGRRLSIVFQVAVGLLLCLAVAAIYSKTRAYPWVTWDDDLYVFQNPRITRGLTAQGVVWAMTALDVNNWHPLTWISLMLDVELFGLKPGPEHLVNVAFHLASSILLLIAMTRLTGKLVRSALVAAIFAVHPLHVESVAWISERKDVLSAFFQILGLWLYAGYARKQSAVRFSAVLLTFACALMAKPMAVTFPFVLLLLDFWPLDRLHLPFTRAEMLPLVREKLPLLAMSAAASVLTVIAQSRGQALAPLDVHSSFASRLMQAAVGYVWYLWKAIWPAKLAFFYPLQPAGASEAFLAVLILAALTGLAWRWRTRRPYVILGWLWFVGMLLPVIGLVQVGMQGTADRYSYLPFIGLSIAAVWLIGDLIEGKPLLGAAVVFAAGACVLVLAVAASRQVEVWRTSDALFEHGLAVTPDNFTAEYNLGHFLTGENRNAEALPHLENAVALFPTAARARNDLGVALLRAGRLGEATSQWTEAHRINPDLVSATFNLGMVRMQQGDYEKARELFTDAVGRSPGNAGIHAGLCMALGKLGRRDEGISDCREALRLQPDLGLARFSLAELLAARGDIAAAIEEYERLLERNPSYPEAGVRLAQLKRQTPGTK